MRTITSMATAAVLAVGLAFTASAANAQTPTYDYSNPRYGHYLTVGPPRVMHPHARPPQRPHYGQPRPQYQPVYRAPQRQYGGYPASPKYYYSQPRRQVMTHQTQQRRVIIRRIVTTSAAVAGGAMIGHGMRGAHAAPASRVPSPQEIYNRVPHKTVRVCVPCVGGYVQNPATCQCDSVRWVPGPMPQ